MSKVQIKNSTKSAWTPLNNDDLNLKLKNINIKDKKKKSQNDPLVGIYEERRALTSKWFEKWTEPQRLLVLEDLLNKCKIRQLEEVNRMLELRHPCLPMDFTRCMPKVLSVYIFSFLDPRSLSRCARVCWHWKWLTEVDQLWLHRCLKLGWNLTYIPPDNQSGTWKRLYIENISAFKATFNTVNKALQLKDLDKHSSHNNTNRPPSHRGGQTDKRPPWKGSDPTPRDIWRNNYIQNDDENEKVQKLRKKGLQLVDDTLRRSRNKNFGSQNLRRSGSLTRSRSAILLDDSAQTDRSQKPQVSYKQPGQSKNLNIATNQNAARANNLGQVGGANVESPVLRSNLAGVSTDFAAVKHVKIEG